MGISSFFKSLFFGKKQELLINSNTSQDRFLNNEEDFVYQPSNYIYQPPIYDEKFVTVCPYCKKKNSKLFKRQRKCEFCKKTVYLRMGSDRVKKVYTKKDADAFDKEQEDLSYQSWIIQRSQGRLFQEAQKRYPWTDNEELLIIVSIEGIYRSILTYDASSVGNHISSIQLIVNHNWNQRSAFILKHFYHLWDAISGNLDIWWPYWIKHSFPDLTLRRKDEKLILELADVLIDVFDLPKKTKEIYEILGKNEDELQNYWLTIKGKGLVNELIAIKRERGKLRLENLKENPKAKKGIKKVVEKLREILEIDNNKFNLHQMFLYYK